MNDEEHEWKTYHNGAQIKSKDIKIWFEFIPFSSLHKRNENWTDFPLQFVDLIKLLISKSICCNDENDLNGATGHFGVEIKTDHQDENGVSFEFTTNKAIKNILKKYSTM
jgi:hypothetical protein